MNEPKDMILMSSDNEVMRINFDTGIYDVLNETLLPFGIKGRIRQINIPDKICTNYELSRILAEERKNREAIVSWLANRVLSLSRSNAKWIYNLLRLAQLSSESEKAKVALVCRAVSVLDNYWVKIDGDSVRWEDVNIRHVPLNEVIAQVALHGKSLTLQGSLNTPELTTQGAYAKAWRRFEDGNLWLLKKGTQGGSESKIEVMVSNLLDKMNVEHCPYYADEDEGYYVCKCPCMSNDNLSILSGLEFYSYCNVNEKVPDIEMMRIDSEGIYKMWIVDYLISNRDRHGGNWGFFYDPNTMEILRCHPLYDHNNAFSNEFMDNEDSQYQFGNMTIKQAAMYAAKRVDFHFTDDIVRSDFMTTKQYDTFMKRAKQLGIKTVYSKDPAIDAINKMKGV